MWYLSADTLIKVTSTCSTESSTLLHRSCFHSKAVLLPEDSSCLVLQGAVDGCSVYGILPQRWGCVAGTVRSQKAVCLLPSPNRVLFALTIFKRLLPGAEDHYESELWHCAAHSCLKRFDAEGGRGAERTAPDVAASGAGGCGSYLLPREPAGDTKCFDMSSELLLTAHFFWS